MFKKVNLAITSCLLTATSFGVLAHGGHDHSDPSSGLIHLAWAAPVLIIGAYVSYRLRKNKLAKDNENEES
jgi:hypothetical protein